MFQVLAALLAGAVQVSGGAEVNVSNLPGVFAAACLDGQARLSPGDAAKIGFDELPSALKQRLGRPASGNVWRLASGGRAYLYILDYPTGPGINPKICGVASDEMNLKSGAEMLDLRLAGGGRFSQPARTMQWLEPQDGYVATATTASNFKVLQVNWLDEADRSEGEKDRLLFPR